MKKIFVLASTVAILFSGCSSLGLHAKKEKVKHTCELGHWSNQKQACVIVKGLKGVVKKVYDDVAFISLENGNSTYIEDKTLKIGDTVNVNIIQKKEFKND